MGSQGLCSVTAIGVGKHSSLWGPQKLNKIDLYGKNLIPMKKLYNLGGHGPLGPPVPTPMVTADGNTILIITSQAAKH